MQARTGLLLDPYFSGTKIAWAMANWPQLREAGDRLAIGTIESWLVWKLTGGAPHHRRHQRLAHAADGARQRRMERRAGRPVRRAARRPARDRRLRRPVRRDDRCSAARSRSAAWRATSRPRRSARPASPRAIPRRPSAPAPSSSPTPGTHPPTSKNRLLSTVLWQLGGRRTYALEGSVFVAGSLIQWLRDSVGPDRAAPTRPKRSRARCADNGGVYLVPALSGLGAPWWEPDARAAIIGPQLRQRRARISSAPRWRRWRIRATT